MSTTNYERVDSRINLLLSRRASNANLLDFDIPRLRRLSKPGVGVMSTGTLSTSSDRTLTPERPSVASSMTPGNTPVLGPFDDFVRRPSSPIPGLQLASEKSHIYTF